MKKIILILVSLFSLLSLSAQEENTPTEGKALEVFEAESLIQKLESTERPYLPFLDKSSMKCGIYILKAGAEDKQQPHSLDEVYYVLEGAAMFTVEEEEIAIKEGDILFVKAHAEHRFHTIVSDLKLLVFFSTETGE